MNLPGLTSLPGVLYTDTNTETNDDTNNNNDEAQLHMLSWHLAKIIKNCKCFNKTNHVVGLPVTLANNIFSLNFLGFLIL